MKTAIARIGEAEPVVTMQDGAVVANSRDVASYFGKDHRHVLDAIDKLLIDTASMGVPNFRQTPFVEPSTGQTYRSFDMDRRAFTLLVMSFTGKKALAFKLRYIDAFEAMEAELQRPCAALDPNDPAQLRALLIGYSEKTIALQGRVAELEPKGRALDLISTASGSLCITDAAKVLRMRPKDLFAYLRGNGWIYRRGLSTHDRAFEDKLIAGFLEHKVSPPDAHGRTFDQVRVTPRGLTHLAAVLSQPQQLELEGR